MFFFKLHCIIIFVIKTMVIIIRQYTLLIMLYVSSRSENNTYCMVYKKIHCITISLHYICYNDTKKTQKATPLNPKIDIVLENAETISFQLFFFLKKRMF